MQCQSNKNLKTEYFVKPSLAIFLAGKHGVGLDPLNFCFGGGGVSLPGPCHPGPTVLAHHPFTVSLVLLVKQVHYTPPTPLIHKAPAPYQCCSLFRQVLHCNHTTLDWRKGGVFVESSEFC